MTKKIILLLILSLLIINGCNNEELQEKNQKITLLTMDKETREGEDSTLIIERINDEYESNKILTKLTYPAEKIKEVIAGKNVKEFFDLTYPNMYRVSCYNGEYYPEINLIALVQDYSENSILDFECEMVKIGKLEISHKGSIKPEESEITLSIKSVDGEYNNALMCLDWSMGIIYATYEENYDVCSENWGKSVILENGKELELEDNAYSCNKKRTQYCEKVDGNTCFKEATPVPEDLDAISCFQIGTLRNNETRDITIKAKAMENIKNEEIIVNIIDQAPILIGNHWEEKPFFENKDLGGKNYQQKII